jgi:hypothetical protein
MIDRDMAVMFPPYFLSETGPSTFGWVWTAPVPETFSAEMVIGEQGALLGTLTHEPTPNGSRVFATADGLGVHLTEADKAGLLGRPVMFGLSLQADGMADERFGYLIFCDWASVPHEGNA